jgi:hypothetical protein
MTCPRKKLISGKNESHAQQCRQHELKIRSLSFALLAKNWFTTP